jgi:hypothetical protein
MAIEGAENAEEENHVLPGIQEAASGCAFFARSA